MAKYRAEHVVADAVAFFRNVQLQDVAENVHSLRSVVNEIKDKATRQRLAVLPYELKLREPSTECIQIVSDFARKTGDYQSLSAVDIRVVALAYQLTKEYAGTDHLKKEPERKVTYSATKKPLQSTKDIVGFYYPSKKSSDKQSESGGDGSSEQTTQQDVNSETGDVELELTGCSNDGENLEDEGGIADESRNVEERTSKIEDVGMENEEEEELEDEGDDDKCNALETEGDRGPDDGRDAEKTDGDHDSEEKDVDEMETGDHKDEPNDDLDIDEDDDGDEDDEDDVGWITPQNISQVRRQMGGGDETNLEGIKVGCMTTDFAMQNVLIQIGIPVISVNGMLIKRAKSFALRCHDCFKVSHSMDKVFCPKCGNRSLDKVTVTVDEDGTQRYHLSRRRPANTRGMRFALPKPQGGKHASNPILTADQRLPHNRDARKGRSQTEVFDPDYEAKNSPFAVHDVTSRSALIGVRQLRSQGAGSRRNPNENRRTGKKGKRR